MRRNKPLLILSILFLFILTIIYLANQTIIDSANGKLYNDTRLIPFNKIGLLLGTTKFKSIGGGNPYYTFRIEAAVRLLKARKIKYLLISGDNSKFKYYEPTSMRNDLISSGVDSNIIFLDTFGLRTFDSILRLKKVFGQDSATIISQAFHNERAIYIASRVNITAIGYNATDLTNAEAIKTGIREKLARVKVFLDFWSGKQPKVLGDTIQLPVQ